LPVITKFRNDSVWRRYLHCRHRACIIGNH
jgi:hypothetical protein